MHLGKQESPHGQEVRYKVPEQGGWVVAKEDVEHGECAV